MTHTPGPWGYDADSREVFADTDQHGCGWIALISGNDTNNKPTPEPERLANAHLIAAAPDLLTALRALMALDVKGHALSDRLQFSDSGRALLDQCRAAIARATYTLEN
jgi:hypothetical protein